MKLPKVDRRKCSLILLSARRRRFSAQQKRRLSTERSNEEIVQDIIKISEHPDLVESYVAKLSQQHRQDIFKLASNKTSEVAEPPYSELQKVAFATSIPFVGFGIMDNAILIIAGDAIDTSLGVWLGISTMCAAAIGNIISDVAGIMLGTVVEDACAKYLRLPAAKLSSAQRQLRSVRFANQFGCGVGIVIGCIIGMFPLLFIDSKKIQAMKDEATMDSLFQDVIAEAGSLIGAQRTMLFLIVDDENSTKPSADGKYLYAKYNPFKVQERYFPLGRGIASRAALTGESWNITDVRNEPDFSADMRTGFPDFRNMLCVPVTDGKGRTIAVLQAVNKRNDTERGFTTSDMQILKALASHISISLQRINRDEDTEHSLKDTIQMLKDYGLKGIADDAQSKTRRPLFPE